MGNFWTPVKVGVLTVFAIVATVVGVSEVTKQALDESDSYEVFAIFDDVSGLRSKSKVQIAGIEVGQVDDISLVGNRAKVTLRIRDDVVLRTDARIAKATEGLLGDVGLDIEPGSETAPAIPDGGEIRNVVSVGAMEEVFETLGDITKDIEQVTQSLSEVLGGEETAHSVRKIVEDLTKLTETVNETLVDSSARVDRILANFEDLSREIRDVTAGESQTIANILHNIEVVTRDTKHVLATVQDILGSSEGELKDGVAGLRQSLEKVNASLDQLNRLTGQMVEGEGTVGRLLTDDTLITGIEDTVAKAEGTVTRIDETVDSAADFVDRLLELRTEIDLRAEYHWRESGLAADRTGGRTVATLQLVPAEDKWYELGIVSPAFPRIDLENQIEVVNGAQVARQVRTSDDDFRVNALFAKRWRLPGVSVTGKFGIIETTGAVAGAVGLLDDRLSLEVEAFEWSDDEKDYPRVRAFATMRFLEHLYVTGGVDDALNSETRPPTGLPPEVARAWFLGGGFFFNDEDLKAIITAVGVPTP